MPKYIFVTGGVVSSLGKGLAASSIGSLLEARGFVQSAVPEVHHSVVLRIGPAAPVAPRPPVLGGGGPRRRLPDERRLADACLEGEHPREAGPRLVVLRLSEGERGLLDVEPEVLRSAAGVAVAVAVRGESELDVEVPLPVLRVPALEREERGKPLARQPLHALGLGGRHVEDRVCLDHGDVAARRFQPLR